MAGAGAWVSGAEGKRLGSRLSKESVVTYTRTETMQDPNYLEDLPGAGGKSLVGGQGYAHDVVRCKTAAPRTGRHGHMDISWKSRYTFSKM